MSCSKKTLKAIKYGFANSKKKMGLTYWRFFFNGISAESSQEQRFYLEFEMLNPWLSPKEVVLGFKPRVTIQEEDLQYALAGTDSAKSLKSEDILQPSYCAIRFGTLGNNSKQLCTYFPVKEVKFSQKPFAIEIGNKQFLENKLTGFLNVTNSVLHESPELLCESGNASWNLSYEYETEVSDGIKKNGNYWFPIGLKTRIAGKVNFDGVDYIIDPRRSYGYSDKYVGIEFPDTWFHISAGNLTSIISGSHLFNSSFTVQGITDEKVSFLGKIEDIFLNMSQTSRIKYDSIWSCTQTPENHNEKDNKLHWSVSITNKIWIIDIDLYSRLTDLYNRKIEATEGMRKVLSVVESGNCTGEIRLYKKNRNDIEQIEYAKIEKAICQFGKIENFE